MKIAKVEQTVSDARGSLVQVVSEGSWRQLNVVTRKAGSLGGGHYHERTEEFFYVQQGSLDLKAINRISGEANVRTFETGDCFLVGTQEQHYMRFQADTVLVILYSAPFNQQSPDILVDSKLPSLNDVFGGPEAVPGITNRADLTKKERESAGRRPQ